MAYQMAFFAADSLEILKSAITNGTVSYPAYVFIRDAEGDSSGQLMYIDKNNTVKQVKNESKKQVVNVDSLPDISDGDNEVLYICNGVVYSFDGEKYIPAYKDHTSEIESLTEKITTLEKENASFTERLTTLESRIEQVETGAGFVFTELE